MQSLQDTNEIVTALVEIEDTNDDKSEGESLNSVSNGWRDCATRANFVKNFLTLGAVSQQESGRTPFIEYEPPVQGSARGDHEPRSRGRMGFIVVFDSCGQKSLAIALGICHELASDVTHARVPPVYLVAAKIDKNPTAPVCVDNIARAKEYVEKVERDPRIQFMEVSALEFTRVRKLFRDIVEDVFQDPELWMSPENALKWKHSQGKGHHEGPAQCSLQ